MPECSLEIVLSEPTRATHRPTGFVHERAARRFHDIDGFKAYLAGPPPARYKEQALRVSPDHVAIFVAYLCSPAAQRTTGQLFGVRGREVFLFAQPRPVARIVRTDRDWAVADLAEAVDREFTARFAELETDLEAFSSAPVV